MQKVVQEPSGYRIGSIKSIFDTHVLVHDEERDDITESTKLYDQMKRHFGLHCHLLRLRSSQCVVTDDDSVQVPSCERLSPQEQLSGAGEADGTPYLFESDATAIRARLSENSLYNP
ncbi:hypothetical protein N7493_010099 [Penicillium malachiteum]|uniref:Uncharacterized protein n=1 Tax=Penicillium malachiteum TaxID=1324776 RepID=A0AAD6MSC6_9EURO|nr:hypothetical protein N7493_010099 [Penicillium malachiteum]